MCDEEERPGVAAAPHGYTLAIVKPDAIGKADEIMHLAELSGFTVIQQQRLQLNVARAEEFYSEHRERPFFLGLVEFMASGPIVAAVLARPGAVVAWRAMVGPTNSLEARVQAPKSLRGLYGTDGTRNAVHGSDSAASAAREARFFFPRLQLLAPAAGMGDQGVLAAYVANKLQPTLVKALAVLAKAKPSSNEPDAIAFLARWMLENNPNRPRVVLPKGATEAAAQAREEQRLRAEAVMQAAAAWEMQPLAGSLPAEATAACGPAGATADEAAIKVQAAFRGHQARKLAAEV